MGQSIAGQINQLPIDMNGNVLTGPNPIQLQGGNPGGQLPSVPIDQNGNPQVGFGMPGGDAAATNPQQAQQMQLGGMPGMGGKGGMMIPQSMGDQVAQQQGGMPGMGGKGPLAQIPIDMNGQVLGTGQGMLSPGSMGQQVADQQANISQPPTATPVGVQQGGTPGRPVPAMPFTPRGPGFNNPGSQGAAMGQPLTGNFQPGGMQNRLQPAPAAPAVPRPGYGINSVVNPRARVTAQPVQSMKRGAGRGGLLR